MKSYQAVNSIPKILGISVLYLAISSINFLGLSVSTIILEYPLRLILVALLNTCVFYSFAVASGWNGKKLWVAIFSLLYGVHYLSLVFESLYLGDFLTSTMVRSLIINGAIFSALYSSIITYLVYPLRNTDDASQNQVMPLREWAWKLPSAGIIYLILFILFGLLVYTPIAKGIDPTGYLIEQEMIDPSGIMLVFPVEIFRGILWAFASIPAIKSLQSGFKRTALLLALLFSVPMSASMLLPTSMSFGLVTAHIIELFGENFIYGILVAWMFQFKPRTSSKQTVLVTQ